MERIYNIVFAFNNLFAVFINESPFACRDYTGRHAYRIPPRSGKQAVHTEGKGNHRGQDDCHRMQELQDECTDGQYEYDSAGRPVRVWDENGKILEESDYHVKNTTIQNSEDHET